MDEETFRKRARQLLINSMGKIYECSLECPTRKHQCVFMENTPKYVEERRNENCPFEVEEVVEGLKEVYE